MTMSSHPQRVAYDGGSEILDAVLMRLARGPRIVLSGGVSQDNARQARDLWRDLRAATAEIRPDWDLSTPGLRQAWDAGDRSPFH